MIAGRDGHHYLTASQIRDQPGYDDVTPALLRTWVDTGHLTHVNVGQLAAALHYPLPAGCDPAQPARAAGPSGPENVYRWADVVAAETATRRARRAHGGRARGRATPHPRTAAA